MDQNAIVTVVGASCFAVIGIMIWVILDQFRASKFYKEEIKRLSAELMNAKPQPRGERGRFVKRG